MNIQDAIAVSEQPNRVFDANPVPPNVIKAIEYNQETMEHYWMVLLKNDADREAYDFFSRSLHSSPIIKTLQGTISTGSSSYRYEYEDYRIIHEFIRNKIVSHRDSVKTLGLVHKMLTHRNVGSLHIFSKILLELYNSTSNVKVKTLSSIICKMDKLQQFLSLKKTCAIFLELRS